MKTLHFLYHELRRDGSAYAYVTEANAFEQQAAFFGKVRMEASESSLTPALTFDDGYRSDCEIALPVLQKHGLHAHFFITAGWTGQKAAYMDWAQLRTLASAGMTVGAHGWSHTLLTHCSDAELDRELRGAREALENGLGQSVTTMSLPGGRADMQVFTSVPRAEDMASAPTHVGRLNVRGGADLAWFERVLAADERLLHKLERSEQIKSIARRTLGDRLYARVWGLLNRQEKPDGAEALAS